jgi:hypothetical protein
MSESKMNELEFRMCKECKVVKPLDINHFYVNRVYKGKSIYRRMCCDCHNAMMIKRRSEDFMREQIRENVRKYYKEHREKRLYQQAKHRTKKIVNIEIEVLHEFMEMRLNEIENKINIYKC